MATTKFLDYTGLSKLVEKIKNTYVRQDSQYEANLKWGGKNLTNSFGPIDAAMIPELGANRFDLGNARGITIEYSNDAGKTWKDYEASDRDKTALISSWGLEPNFIIGKTKSSSPANDMLRITIDTGSDTGITCYSILNKFCIYCSTEGSTGSYCTIQKALQSTPTNFVDVITKVPISGWSGYNIINTSNLITFGNTPTMQYGRIRFIFGCTGNTSTYSGLSIKKLKAFGGVGWSTPSTMAKYGTPYYIDSANGGVVFTSYVTAAGGFNGTLNGNAATATKATNADNASKVNNHTVLSDVPANAKFTDTHYASGLRVGASGTNTNSATTNGNTYIKITEQNIHMEGHLIKGTGATTVTSDSSGNITIDSTNTTYNDATTSSHGLMTAGDKTRVNQSVYMDPTNGYVYGYNNTQTKPISLFRCAQAKSYDVIFQKDSKTGMYLYDGTLKNPTSGNTGAGVCYGAQGISYEIFPANCLIGNGFTYATAVSTDDIQSWINEAIQ